MDASSTSEAVQFIILLQGLKRELRSREKQINRSAPGVVKKGACAGWLFLSLTVVVSLLPNGMMMKRTETLLVMLLITIL